MLAAYIVNTSLDVVDAMDNVVSLREAVQAANTNVIVGDAIAGEAGVTDTITFIDGLSTITLNSQLSITESLEISLGDATTVTLSGNNSSRIFSIDAGSDLVVPTVVSISGLTLTGGSADSGGAIQVSAVQSLTLDDVTLTQNVAVGNDVGQGGGAIFSAGTLEITASQIAGNIASGTAGSGGGIYNAGTLTVSGTLITGNVANRAGGGIESAAGSTNTLTGVLLVANNAGVGGSAATATPLLAYDFNEAGNAAIAMGTAATSGDPQLLFSDNDGNPVDLHSADGGGVSGQPGDFAFDNTGSAGSNITTASHGQQAADFDAIDALDAFTLSGWFKLPDTATESIGRQDALIENGTISVNDDAGGFRLRGGAVADSGALELTVNTQPVESSGAYTEIGEYVYFAVTYDGTKSENNVKFYKGTRNGGVQLVNTLSLNAGPVAQESIPLSLGVTQTSGLTLNPFQGLLDNVRIDGSVLSLGELESQRFGVTGLGNSVVANPGNGGGLHISGNAVVTINNGTVSGNLAAGEGGGLWNSSTGTLTVDGTMVRSNSATEGGGIYGDGSKITLSNVNVSANSASLNGGGIYIANDGDFSTPILTITDGIIDGNSAGATVAGSGGGGIYAAGSAELTNTIITNNTAASGTADGGGILNGGRSFVINGGEISGNSAARAGGGIEVAASAGAMQLIDTDLMDNSAGINGGAVHLSGASLFAINAATVSGNTAGNEGGGLWGSSTGNLTVNDGTYENNSAMFGGAIFGDGSVGQIQVNGGTFTSNAAAVNGGAIAIEGGKLQISGATFNTNSAGGNAAGLGGGAIFSAADNSWYNVDVMNNSAAMPVGNGGGILIAAGGTGFLFGGTISGNMAGRAGGGVENAGQFLLAVGQDNDIPVPMQINANSAGVNGGGVHISGAGEVTVRGAEVMGNTAAGEGGGLWNSVAGILNVNTTTVSNNVASGDDADQGGGGIYSDGGLVEIMESTISDNLADGVSGSGGGILIKAATLMAVGTSITGNVAVRAGGGIETTGAANTTLTDVNLDNNSAGLDLSVAGLNIPAPLLAYNFNETGEFALATGTVSDADGNPNLNFNANGSTTPADLHSGAGTGVSGAPGDRAFDNTGGDGFFDVSHGQNEADVDAIDELSAFTLSGWFQLPSSATESIGRQDSLFENATVGSDAAGFRLRGGAAANSGTLELTVDGVARESSAVYTEIGEYVYFAVSYDGTASTDNVKFYKGTSSDTLTLVDTFSLDAGAVDSDDLPLFIGANRQDFFRNPFSGLLDNIRIDGSALPMQSLEFLRADAVGQTTGFRANPGNGGGLHVGGPGIVLINGGTISENFADNEGGGVWNSAAGSITIDGTTVDGNTAAVGGGVYNQAAADGTNAADIGSGTIMNAMITNNTATSDIVSEGGGGLFNAGSLTIDASSITGNTAAGERGSGGGILNDVKGVLDVRGATIANNRSMGAMTGDGGGGIASVGILTIENSTVSGNTADASGGGIAVLGGTATLRSATIADNQGNGGGVFHDGGTLDVFNTVIAANFAGDGGTGTGADVLGAFDNIASSFVGSGDGASGVSDGQNGNIVGGDSMLGDLADNGGPTMTQLPQSGSPLINAGDNAVLAGQSFDQRGEGFDRITAINADIGAVEVQDAVAGPIQVSTFDDIVDATDGLISLREAIMLANANAGANTIQLASGTYTLTITGVDEDSNASGDLDITDDLTILGADGATSIIDASALDDRAFEIFTATVSMSGVTISGGTTDGDGGGILNRGDLALEGVTISGNTASGNAANNGGGGIYNAGGMITIVGGVISDNVADGTSGSGGGVLNKGGMLTISDGTIISGNRANRAGGGIETAGGSVTLTDVILGSDADGTNDDMEGNSVADNPAPGNGGGLHIGGNGVVTVTGGSVVGNSAVEGGGLWNSGAGTLTIDGTTIADNTAVRGGGVYQEAVSTTQTFTVDLQTLNGAYGSTATGTATITLDTSGVTGANSGTATIRVQINATGLPDLTDVTGGIHVAHIHGQFAGNAARPSADQGDGPFFDGEGGAANGFAPSKSTTPTTADDGAKNIDESAQFGQATDFLDFFEGRPDYGPVVLNLTANQLTPAPDGTPPLTFFFQELGAGNIDAAAEFPAGTTFDRDTTYSFDLSDADARRQFNNLTPLNTREIVLHGLVIPKEISDAIDAATGAAPGSPTAGVDQGDGTSFRRTAPIAAGTLVSSSGMTTITNATISGNTATGDLATEGGGGIYNEGGTLIVNNSTIVSNAANGTLGSGGGIFSLDGEVSLNGTNIGGVSESSGNTASRAGGGLEVVEGHVSLEGFGGFSNNSAGINGGGLHITGAAIVDSARTTYTGNTAASEGGGLWNSATGTINIDGGIISGNVASGDAADNGGGGIFNDGGLITTFGGVISANSAEGMSGSGGGVLNNGGTLEFGNGTIISGNRANRAGGGIETVGGSATLDGVIIRDNTVNTEGATGNPGNGGGVHVGGNGVVTITGSSVTGNSAVDGGGLWNGPASTLTVTSSTVANNTAEDGGGIYNSGTGGNITVTNSTIAGNAATGKGGGIASEGANVTLTSVTIATNTAATGGGIQSDAGIVSAINAIIASNTATSGPDVSGSLTSNGNNLIGDTADATLVGTFASDLLNVDAGLGVLADNGGPTQTISLLASSPALNAGVAAGLAVDQRGVTRPQGSGFDIGAFESDLNTPATPTLSITAANADQNEGNSGVTAFTFTVTRADVMTGATSVNFVVSGSGTNAADANDFQTGAFPSGTVSFADGETSKTVTVNVAGDTVFESDETFIVTLSGATGGATISMDEATGTIRNDDVVATPTLSVVVANADQNEGNSGETAFTFTVTRADVTTGVTSIDYVVSGSGANAADANDFQNGTFPSGTVSFADGETSKTITVNVAGDTVFESDETFVVTLSGATGGATISMAAATGTIRNDDAAVTPTLSITAANADQSEGNSGVTAFTFTVTRADFTTGATSVNYVVSGSGTNAANANDFQNGTFPSGTVSFADGETSKTITVNVAGDTISESDETFIVTLSGATGGATISVDAATGTIRNDDRLDGDTRILIPVQVVRSHVIPGDGIPTAIIFQALTDAIVTVLPVGFASVSENVYIVDGNTQQISQYINGVTTANVIAGGLYAIIFEPQTEDRIFSVRSSAGFDSLSNEPSTNILQPTDTTGDGTTTALDALRIVNELNLRDGASGEPLAGTASSSMFLDVNRDNSVTALDALIVINYLNRQDATLAGNPAGETLAMFPQQLRSTDALTSNRPTDDAIDQVFTADDARSEWLQTADDSEIIVPQSERIVSAASVDEAFSEEDDQIDVLGGSGLLTHIR